MIVLYGLALLGDLVALIMVAKVAAGLIRDDKARRRHSDYLHRLVHHSADLQSRAEGPSHPKT
jgi:hypothetical protein